MTRRTLILLAPAVIVPTRFVKAINGVSAAGMEADRAFLAWGAVWNAMVKEIEHVDRSLEESAAWDELTRLFLQLQDAHYEYTKKR